MDLDLILQVNSYILGFYNNMVNYYCPESDVFFPFLCHCLECGQQGAQGSGDTSEWIATCSGGQVKTLADRQVRWEIQILGKHLESHKIKPESNCCPGRGPCHDGCSWQQLALVWKWSKWLGEFMCQAVLAVVMEQSQHMLSILSLTVQLTAASAATLTAWFWPQFKISNGL